MSMNSISVSVERHKSEIAFERHSQRTKQSVGFQKHNNSVDSLADSLLLQVNGEIGFGRLFVRVVCGKFCQ